MDTISTLIRFGSTRESKQGARIALFVGLLAGLFAFAVCEQLVPLALSRNVGSLINLPTCLLTFFPVALVGVTIGSLGMRIGGQRWELRVPLGLALALALVTVARLLLTSVEPGHPKAIAVSVSVAVVLIAAWSWTECRGSSSLGRWLFAGLVWDSGPGRDWPLTKWWRTVNCEHRS